MVKFGSAIKNQVAMGQKENDFIKKNADYSLNPFITKDKKKICVKRQLKLNMLRIHY